MSEQRRIDLLFASTVRVIAIARVARRSAPALALALVIVVAVHGTLGGIDAGSVPRVAVEVSEAQPSEVQLTAVQRTVSETEPPIASGRADNDAASAAPARERAPSVPPLDPEQLNIARFIAARYRVGVESTSEFVYHAYRAARDVKVDPMLVLAVMSVESRFNPKAQSHAGAQGLMQVLTRVHAEKFQPFGGIPAAFDPVANIRVGSAILKEYIKREGSVEGALKSYVGAALAEHDGGYGVKVLNARERIAAAAAGRPIPVEVVAAPVRAEPAPTMQPVSRIVETSTPLPLDEPKPAATDPVPVGVEARDHHGRSAVTPAVTSTPVKSADEI
jgi:soluble lytic murein transglycosylase-like protein